MTFDHCNQWIVPIVRSQSHSKICSTKFDEAFCFDCRKTYEKKKKKDVVVGPLLQQHIQQKKKNGSRGALIWTQWGCFGTAGVLFCIWWDPPSPTKYKKGRAYEIAIGECADGNTCDGHLKSWITEIVRKKKKVFWFYYHMKYSTSSNVSCTWGSRTNTHTVTNALYSCKCGFGRVLINVTGCDQGQRCDVSAGPL